MNFRRILAVIGILCILLNGCGDSQKHIPEDPGVNAIRIGGSVWEVQFTAGYYTLLIGREPDVYDKCFINTLYHDYKERKTTPNEEWEIVRFEFSADDEYRSVYQAVSTKGIAFYNTLGDLSYRYIEATVERNWQDYME